MVRRVFEPRTLLSRTDLSFLWPSRFADWLFGQIDAAVHHGGAGTTGASLRAGLPTIIKPWFGDQVRRPACSADSFSQPFPSLSSRPTTLPLLAIRPAIEPARSFADLLLPFSLLRAATVLLGKPRPPPRLRH